MQFLSPIWFIALAALAVPIIIHLWNIKAGKTLKVGSIALISEASKTSRRSFKLLDILLLVTRCLLLALLALFLAAPVWQRLKQVQKVKGWVLVPKERAKQTYQKFKPVVDSLIRSGYGFHYFNKGFAKADIKKILEDTVSQGNTATAAVNYWGLVSSLNDHVASSLPVYLFTPDGISHFKGARPPVTLNLHWQTYTAADSVRQWIAAASFTANNAIKVITGNSSPAGTYYTSKYIRGDGNAAITVKVQNGQPFVRLKNKEGSAIAVDTATLRIALYTDKYALDAVYLKAALSAIVNFTGQKAVIKTYDQTGQIPGGQNWLFWLSDKPVDGRLLTGSKNVFKYEAGKAATVSSWINTGSRFTIADNGEKIRLGKLILAGDKTEPVWHDGFGRVVLSLDMQHNVNIYHLYTHFNPQWNDLVWSDIFPEMMLKLIDNHNDQFPEQFDKRILSARQVNPVRIGQAAQTASVNPIERVDISSYFWLLIVLLFVAERILSHKIKSIQTNG